MKRSGYLLLGSIMLCCLLTACSIKRKPLEREARESEYHIPDADNEQAESEKELESVPSEEEEQSGASEAIKKEYARGGRIEEQTFQVTLAPFGEVTFASYEPDLSEDPLADAVFLIERDGKVLTELPGMTEDNCRVNESFNKVEAVSFLDYNQDGYDDIILICNYSPVSGPETGSACSEIRYYKGAEDGAFSYEEPMSQDATSALAEITIQTAKGFIGVGKKVRTEPWQDAYLNYLNERTMNENMQSYGLIYLDQDEIPELVEIGYCEADGCRIINFSDGEAHVTRLYRLNFSYIEKQNLLCNSDGLMDQYYDRIYQITDGKMKLIAEGLYGAENNSALQIDPEGNPVYEYTWNGKKMSKQEYEREFENIYDMSSAKPRCTEEYSLEEIKAIIQAYYSD